MRVPHKGNVVEKVIEGAFEMLGVLDSMKEKRDAMQSLMPPPLAQQAIAKAALSYRFGELKPRHSYCVTLYHNGLTFVADTLGSYGYVCLSVYPTPPST